ncbi:MAG: hypothetical protein KAJ18_00285 [Candidatus Omnitrophica bacterium]|nr:hypothetical protein [Candidatus Omnitrophota bacterium]
MITEIGVVCGEILTFLEKAGRPLNVEEIKTYSDKPYDLLLMAVEYLSREGYVRVKEGIKEEYLVTLVPHRAFNQMVVQESFCGSDI